MICKRSQPGILIRLLQVISTSLLLISFMAYAEPDDKQKKNTAPVLSDAAKAGKMIAFSRKKGNCLACHVMAGGESPGNIGPPLIQMRSRYSDKEKLRAIIWDSTARNPETSMPPFGRHKIISESEIDMVTEFIWTL